MLQVHLVLQVQLETQLQTFVLHPHTVLQLHLELQVQLETQVHCLLQEHTY